MITKDFLKGIAVGVIIVLYLAAIGLSVYNYRRIKGQNLILNTHAQVIQQLINEVKKQSGIEVPK